MKIKLFFLFTLIYCLSLVAPTYGQTADDKLWFSLSYVNPQYNGDYYNNEMFKFDIFNDAGFGLGAHYFLSPDFDVDYNFIFGHFDEDEDDAFFKNFIDNNFLLRYKFANDYILEEDFVIQPYVTAGLGVGFIFGDEEEIGDATYFNIPFGVGVDYPIGDKFKLFTSLSYHLTFFDGLDGDKDGVVPSEKQVPGYVAPNDGNDHDDYMAWSLGVKFNLFGAKDTDGDGVSDKKDKCPESFGSIVTNGCPDEDIDGIADMDDRCPSVAGLAEFEGCPDSDMDGIADIDDACPDIAGLDKFKGCKDTDNDGVADPQDACPRLAGIASAKGCPDADKDGIIDSKDACPNVAGDVSTGGCPDTDGDGVLDKDDACPNEVGNKGNKGCAGVSAEVLTQLDTVFRNLLFANGKAVIDNASFPDLDNLVTILNNDPDLKLTVSGYTDSRGSAANNLKLSQDRAQAVKDYLVKKGVEANRITAQGFGETQPIATNDTAEGRRKNRRVELSLSYK